MSNPTSTRFAMPHTLVVVMALVVLVLAASWVIPSGEYERVELQTSEGVRTVTVAGTYREVPKIYLGPQTVLEAPIKGFLDGALLIGFLMVIGGSFAIFQETGAVEFGIRRLTDAIGRRRSLEGLLIPALMVVFSLGGSIFGMAEETIPFIVIFIPLARRLGYDSIVGIAIPFLGSVAGFSAAFFNPFTVGISQSIAGLPLYSGLGYRTLSWVIGTAVTIAYVMWYARRVKRNPDLSPVRDIDLARGQVEVAGDGSVGWQPRHVGTLALFLASMVLLVVGVLRWQWYIDQIAVLFFGMGIVLGLSGGMGPSRIARTFVAGAKDMVGVVFIIACARAPRDRAGREDPGHGAVCGLADALAPAAGGDRAGDVPRPVRDQLLHPFGHGAGGPHHAGDGAARRSRRTHPADGGLRVPVVRVREPDPPDERRDDGRAGRREGAVGTVGEVVPAADADPDGAQFPAVDPARAAVPLGVGTGTRAARASGRDHILPSTDSPRSSVTS
jgi:hypothetical protein